MFHQIHLSLALFSSEMNQEIPLNVVSLLSLSPQVEGMKRIRVESALREEEEMLVDSLHVSIIFRQTASLPYLCLKEKVEGSLLVFEGVGDPFRGVFAHKLILSP